MSDIRVEVVYALPDLQRTVALALKAESTVGDAIEQANLSRYFPDLDSTVVAVGIWGRQVNRSTRLSSGDRVELYRALPQNPRQMRRSRVAESKTMGDSPQAGGA